MIGIKFIIKDRATNKVNYTQELDFAEWTERVHSLVEVNRKTFEEAFPNSVILVSIVNKERA